jgi:hypothetical protein
VWHCTEHIIGCKCGWCGRTCVVNCSAVLVISLTVIDYFSKKVVNDVIKSEVSTGAGIFFWKTNCQPGQKVI